MAQEKWIIDGPKIIDVDSISTLKVGLIGGQIDIIATDDPGVHIEVHEVSGRDLKISVDGDTLEIDHPQLRWDNFIDVFKSFNGKAKADLSISVPRNIALKFGAVTASGLISGLASSASISTVSGDLVIDGIEGDLQLNSVSGEISVRNHAGAISANSVSGDLIAQGSIHKFKSDSVSGDVFLDVTGTPYDYRINTVSGAITTRLASDIAAKYTINTVNGRLQLDNAEIRGIHGNYSSKYGALDREWLDFKANTVSGNISVVHGAES